MAGVAGSADGVDAPGSAAVAAGAAVLGVVAAGGGVLGAAVSMLGAVAPVGGSPGALSCAPVLTATGCDAVGGGVFVGLAAGDASDAGAAVVLATGVSAARSTEPFAVAAGVTAAGGSGGDAGVGGVSAAGGDVLATGVLAAGVSDAVGGAEAGVDDADGGADAGVGDNADDADDVDGAAGAVAADGVLDGVDWLATDWPVGVVIHWPNTFSAQTVSPTSRRIGLW